MAASIIGNAKGTKYGDSGSAVAGYQVANDGSIVEQLASGKNRQLQDHSGNVLGYQDENSRPITVVVVPLAAVDTGGGIFAWQNPHAGSIIISRIYLDVTTVATGACTVDAGTTATSAVTLSDNMLDGVDVHTATGLQEVGNGDAPGAGNGKNSQKLATGKWVTGSKASGASAGLVGNAYIHYHQV